MTWYLFLRNRCSLSEFSLSYAHWCKTFTMYFFFASDPFCNYSHNVHATITALISSAL